MPAFIEIGGAKIQLSKSLQNRLLQNLQSQRADSGRFAKTTRLAQTYLPLLREIFQENGLPPEFCYLSLLDNPAPDTLLLWNMPPEVALQLGLQINENLDERLHPLAATKAIAKKLQKNQTELQNPLLTLLSYHLSNPEVLVYVGTKLSQSVREALRGQKPVLLDVDAHPDLLRFLNLYFLYENRPENLPFITAHWPEIELIPFPMGEQSSLPALAKKFLLSESQMQTYNPWLKSPSFSLSPTYEVLIPMPASSPSQDVRITPARGGGLLFETPTEGQIHIVQAGETLFGLSRRYGLSVETLRQLNGLSPTTPILVGQKLLISQGIDEIPTPTPSTNTSEFIYHTVQKGESLYRISRLYQVEVIDLKEWNDLYSNEIRVGQKLKVKTSVPAPNPNPSPTPPSTPSPQPEAPPLPPGPRVLGPKTVPSEMTVGGICLRISPSGKEALEKDVQLLVRHPSYFFQKLHQVDVYAPLIQEALRDEAVPLDFQYLPIQESELVANAVSRSQAVGYWQFKEASAIEAGLTVNNEVDERMNIVAATRGAARYLKRNQEYFNNWVFSLLSFNLGFTGAKNHLLRQYPHQKLQEIKEMEITDQTHWYIRKFLAHKIAFETEINREVRPQVLSSFEEGQNKTLAQIAREQNSDLNQMMPHNLWLKKNRVPADKSYSVILSKPNKP
ncbi:MAG: hypothetical protein OHK0053_08360 [Microscillaceae bacterium]